MGFRDEGLASQERAEALEREVERLKAENAELRQEAAPPAEARRPRGGPRRLATPLALVGLVTGVAAVLAPLPPQARLVLALCSVLTGTLALMMMVVGSLLHVVEPGELLVLSGVSQMGPDHRRRGYRVVTSGRVLRKPILETATWMSLGPYPFTLDVRGVSAARSRVDLRVSATIGVSTRPGIVDNAVERFLGRPQEELVEVARQTIEGVLRELVASLTLPMLQMDGHEVAEELHEALEYDFEKLGLELTTLVIEDVSATREG